MAEILRREIALRCPPARAFAAFTEQVDLWWPRGHRKSAEGNLRFEPGPDGKLVERGPDGAEWVMAAIRGFDPPARLELDWFPGSPLAPTRVVVRFDPRGPDTLVTIVHQPLTPEAEAVWPQRVALFEKGWDAVLPALNMFVSTQGGSKDADPIAGG